MAHKESDYAPQFRQYLTQAGDGTGAFNLNGNYSIVTTDFFIQPPADKVYMLGLGILNISDNGAFAQTDYGAMSGGLTNGISLLLERNNVETDIFAGQLFKQNVDWVGVGEYNMTTFSGSAQTLSIRLINYNLTGGYVKLDGYNGDRLIARLRDDFTGLVRHSVLFRGIVLDL